MPPPDYMLFEAGTGRIRGILNPAHGTDVYVPLHLVFGLPVGRDGILQYKRIFSGRLDENLKFHDGQEAETKETQ